MTNNDQCKWCKGHIMQPLGRGRRRKYCSTECRQAPKEQARLAAVKERREQAKCVICGKSTAGGANLRKYCSKGCQAIRNLAAAEAKRREKGILPKAVFYTKLHEKARCVCNNCGKSYWPKQWGRTTYCSRECTFDYWRKFGRPRKQAQCNSERGDYVPE